jgi:hypothetical protein
MYDEMIGYDVETLVSEDLEDEDRRFARKAGLIDPVE